MLVGLRSRKHIPAFELIRPVSVEQLCRAVSEPGRVAVMAGGLDLIDRLKGGEPVDRIVHLAGVRELSGIRRDGEISIGALTTHAQLADSDCWPICCRIFRIWRSIANPRVRLAGTLGGNLMPAAPHYDAWPALLALGAMPWSSIVRAAPRRWNCRRSRGRDISGAGSHRARHRGGGCADRSLPHRIGLSRASIGERQVAPHRRRLRPRPGRDVVELPVSAHRSHRSGPSPATWRMRSRAHCPNLSVTASRAVPIAAG